jgi:hypothetical protein
MIANLIDIQKIYSEIPNTWTVDGIRIDNYSQSTDHFSHGWRQVVIPEITEYQRLGDEFIREGEIVTKEVIDFTAEEIAAENARKVQQYLEKISAESAKLNRSALRRAIGKEASKFDYLKDKDLNDLKEIVYPRKKLLAETYLATGQITNQTLFNSMYYVECEIDFAGEKLNETIAYLNSINGVEIPTTGLTRMQLFCYIVLTKFALGSFLYEELTALSEVFRITSLTRLDLMQLEKLDAGFLLLQDLHLITDLQGFYDLKTQFDAL